MNSIIYYYFLKTFAKESYAENFLNGSIFMKPLEYFTTLDASDESGRGDRHEGISAWLQPNMVNIKIGGIKICSDDLTAPVVCRHKLQLAKNVLCMHAAYISDSAPLDLLRTTDSGNQLRIPSENISLGQHSVFIKDGEEFLNRVKNAVLDKNLSMRCGLVNYYDPAIAHSQFNDDDAPFNKQQKFSYQREYRIVIEKSDSVPCDFTLEIGCIRDIALPMSIDEINSSIRVNQLIY